MKPSTLQNILSFVLFPVWFFLFLLLFGTGHSFYTRWVAVASILVMLVVHEALHVLAIRVLQPGARVTVGIRRPVSPYIRIEGDLTPRTRVLFLLTPFVVLTLAFTILSAIMPGGAVLWVILASLNATGSTYDLWRAFTVACAAKVAVA